MNHRNVHNVFTVQLFYIYRCMQQCVSASGYVRLVPVALLDKSEVRVSWRNIGKPIVHFIDSIKKKESH